MQFEFGSCQYVSDVIPLPPPQQSLVGSQRRHAAHYELAGGWPGRDEVTGETRVVEDDAPGGGGGQAPFGPGGPN